MTCHTQSAWLLFAIAGVLALIAYPSNAQDVYPSRPIRIIVPTGPGGGSTDLSARLIAQGLTRSLGRQVVVENRPGAASIIGSEMVAKAPPDGYTLLLTPSTLAINPATYKQMPYDGTRDFAPITQTVVVASIVAIHPSLPARNLKEFIAFARIRPGEISYATPGHGSHPHLTLALLASMAHVRIVHVPYSKGIVAGISDVLTGRVPLMATSNTTLLVPHMRAGRLRALGVTTGTRVESLPDLPTIAEAGLPGYESVQWSGFLAPAGTPRGIVAKLHQETVTILHGADVTEKLRGAGAAVVTSTPEAFGAFIKAETAKWAKVAKLAGIQPE